MGIPVVTKTVIRSGSSFYRDANIDGFLDDPKDLEVLYKKWPAHFPEPYNFSGGEKVISCEMVLEVALSDLVKVYGVQRANRLVAAAQKGTQV